MPGSVAGRWALGLWLLSVASFAFMTAAVATGQRGGDTLGDNWLLAAPALLAGLSSVASGCVGAYAILRRHDHAVMVYLSTAMGLLVVVFVVGEVFATH
jgi:membrane associated rhomboid family serine protease